jgi:DNA gyrase subunit A
MLVTEAGMIVRTTVAEIRQTGRGAQGVRVIGLHEGDKLAGVARLEENEA